MMICKKGALVFSVSAAVVAVYLGGATRSLAQTADRKANETLLQGNYAGAVPMLKMLAERGDKSAQRMLGSMYEAGIGGVTKSYAEAFKWYSWAAQKGDAEAHSALGRFYAHGYGGVVPRDYKQALSHFEIAEKEGSRSARVNLANLYKKGWGVPQNFETGFKYCELAAKQGFPVAQYNLAELYRKGIGVEQNLDEAKQWYDKCAFKLLDGAVYDQQAYQLHIAIGKMYQNGWGFQKNPAISKQWYSKGIPTLKAKAQAGDVEAIFTLAEITEHGFGVPKNATEATRLYKLAASKGDNEAKFQLGRSAPTATPSGQTATVLKDGEGKVLPPLAMPALRESDGGSVESKKSVIESNTSSTEGIHSKSETKTETKIESSEGETTESSSTTSGSR